VPNWSFSRNYKENWNSSKISVTPEMHLTQGGSVQRPLTSGPRGRLASQTPWPVSPTLWPLTGWLHRHAPQEVVIRNPKLEVGESWTPWPPSHVARPVSQHRVCYRLNQVGNSSLDPYKYPLSVEFKTPHSFCSSPLVKVSV
jgi:hypothetical protein